MLLSDSTTLPTSDELPCSDDTPVDKERLAQYLRSVGIDPDLLPG